MEWEGGEKIGQKNLHKIVGKIALNWESLRGERRVDDDCAVVAQNGQSFPHAFQAAQRT